MSGAHRRTDRRVTTPPKTINYSDQSQHEPVEFDAEAFSRVSNSYLTPLQVQKRLINPKDHEANVKFVTDAKTRAQTQTPQGIGGEGPGEGGGEGGASGGSPGA